MSDDVGKLRKLFDRLGLDSNDQAIRTFIHTNRPLPKSTPLYRANIWNQLQSAFLEEAIREDNNWSALVEKLEALLKSEEEKL